MILTLVRITENPFGDRLGGRSPVGEVGFLLDGFGNLNSQMSKEGQVAVETFTKDGGHGATYYHVPATCVEQVLDRDWYEAFEKYYDKHPYYEINLEFLVRDDPSMGVWLHVGRPGAGGWLNYKHRVLGSEDLNDPNELVRYWETVANRFGGTILVVDPYVQMLCLDYEAGDRKFPRYHRIWADNVLRAQHERATEQHRDDVSETLGTT